MKTLHTAAMLLGAITLFMGCDRKVLGPAHGQQQEFRRQVADSIPVKQWGYTIADVRISEDAQKVLVVFNLPGETNGVNELVLTNDGFRKYRGSIFDSATRKAAEREHWAADAVQRSNRWARMEEERSNTMARMQAGTRPIVPSFMPPDDNARSLSSLFESGTASVTVTLPDR
jgi:hypothetical protein